MSGLMTLALVGNPNTGKTTLFNGITGARERVGNWSGVTVDQAQANAVIGGHEVRIVDLPGIFTLDGHTLDERISGNFIKDQKADLIINVVDASNLERSLCLTRTLLDMGVRIVVALNLMDVAERRGLHIKVAALEQAIGCPVVPVVASQGEGIETLRMVLGKVLPDAIRSPAGPVREIAKTEEAAQTRREFARALAHAVVQRDAPPGERTADRVDRVLLNAWVGIPLFLGIMYSVFWLTVRATQPLVEFMDSFVSAFLVHGLRALLEHWHWPGMLVNVLTDGAGAGMAAVATFMPPIFVIFLCLGVLEGTGYMPRAAFVMDRLLRKIGLPGKAFIPLVVGFGCTVPGLLSTRTLAQRRERVLTMLITPFMSCGARLPVYTIFALAFFPHKGDRVVFALYLTGILLAIFSGLLLHRTILKGISTSYVLELPPYQAPPIRMCLDHAWFNLRSFLVRAGQVIVCVVVALSLLNEIGRVFLPARKAGAPESTSVSMRVGQAITPVFGSMGIQNDNWPATVGLLTGVLAKESVIGALNVMYAQAGEAAAEAKHPQPFSLRGEIADSLYELGAAYGVIVRTVKQEQEGHASWKAMLEPMRQSFGSGAAAFAYLLFVLIYSPCLAALAVLAREAGWRWMIFSVTYQTLLAWMVATVFYQSATWSSHPQQSLSWMALIGSVLLAGMAGLWWKGRQTAVEVQL